MDPQHLNACSANACLDLRMVDQTAARFNDSSAQNYLEQQQTYALQQATLRMQVLEQAGLSSHANYIAKIKSLNQLNEGT